MQQASRGKGWAGEWGQKHNPSRGTSGELINLQGPLISVREHQKIPQHHPSGLETPDDQLSAHFHPALLAQTGQNRSPTGGISPENVHSASVLHHPHQVTDLPVPQASSF